jgi:hypothetical protein
MSQYALLKPLIVDGKLQPIGAIVRLTGPQADWLDGIDVISKSGAGKVTHQVPAILAPQIPRKRCRGCGW